MIVHASDTQTVTGSVTTLFTIYQASTEAHIILKNVGANMLAYRFQEWTGSAWSDIGISGSDTYNTLTTNQIKFITVSSAYPKVQLIGNASGGSTLEFTVTRNHDRDDGGPLPLFNV